MQSSPVVAPPHVAGPLRLSPFRALRLTPKRVGDPASARAFGRPYAGVPARLARWEGRGLLTRDVVPAVYLHEYTAAGLTVRGLVGTLDMTRRAVQPEDRAILPHEGIHPAQADELADRMYEMRLNPAPILLVHRASDELRASVDHTMKRAPDHDFVDHAEQHHRVWAITSRNEIDALADGLTQSRALIADGHHRYAAYLRLQQRHPGGAEDRGLAMLVDQVDTPLFLGAIHRILHGVSVLDVCAAATTAGLVCTRTTSTAAVSALGPGVLVVTDNQSWATVQLPHEADRTAVELLHEVVVPGLPRGPRSISHHHSVEQTLARLRSGRDAAVLVPAPSVDQVMRIVGHDHLLPEKATSFQPKPSVGVMMRSLLDERDGLG